MICNAVEECVGCLRTSPIKMATAAGLQRSVVTFRRSGSSGLVWEMFQQPKKEGDGVTGVGDVEFSEPRPSSSVGTIGMYGPPPIAYRTTERISPATEPPSLKNSICGCCGFFRKHDQSNSKNKKTRK